MKRIESDSSSKLQLLPRRSQCSSSALLRRHHDDEAVKQSLRHSNRNGNGSARFKKWSLPSSSCSCPFHWDDLQGA